ncbi:hypothetical protein GO002_04960 [Streptomyces eurocidicus]|nr:hypothetical protein [Streptomyces eurocidicus]
MTASLTDRQHEHLRSRTPVGRAARPEETGAAAPFLTSDRAAYLPGAVPRATRRCACPRRPSGWCR